MKLRSFEVEAWDLYASHALAFLGSGHVALAMKGGQLPPPGLPDTPLNPEQAASVATAYADAMLLERRKRL